MNNCTTIIANYTFPNTTPFTPGSSECEPCSSPSVLSILSFILVCFLATIIFFSFFFADQVVGFTRSAAGSEWLVEQFRSSTSQEPPPCICQQSRQDTPESDSFFSDNHVTTHLGQRRRQPQRFLNIIAIALFTAQILVLVTMVVDLPRGSEAIGIIGSGVGRKLFGLLMLCVANFGLTSYGLMGDA